MGSAAISVPEAIICVSGKAISAASSADIPSGRANFTSYIFSLSAPSASVRFSAKLPFSVCAASVGVSSANAGAGSMVMTITTIRKNDKTRLLILCFFMSTPSVLLPPALQSYASMSCYENFYIHR